MRKRVTVLLSLALVAGLVTATASAVSGVECPNVAPPPLSFDDRVYVDTNRAGGEPVSVIGQDGSINISAHAGTTHIYKDPDALPGYEDFLMGYSNQVLNWRSEDGGRSWEYVGIAGLQEGPHSATSTGFSDPDYAIDQAGTIYNTEINLANVAVFSSFDDGESYTIANPEATSGDRPWLAALEPGEVFLYVNTGQQLWRSTDSGLTWGLVNIGVAINSKPYTDPRNPDNGLIGPVGANAIAITADDGETWTTYQGAGLGPSVDFFDVMGVDRAGYVYKAAAGGYTGGGDVTPNGSVTFNYFDRETEEWGESAVTIPIPEGDALFPWIVGGDDGRAAVAWYQNFPDDPEAFYIMVAYTTNAHGTTVTCSDGSQQFVPPQFSVVNASHEPIHRGYICLSGTTCNANVDFARGDRRLGDFFTINFDHQGRLFIASGDTTLPNPVGGTKPVGNPIFIAQQSGARMLEQPDAIRPTRCIYPTQDTPLCNGGVDVGVTGG